jgi:hypothetical protein
MNVCESRSTYRKAGHTWSSHTAWGSLGYIIAELLDDQYSSRLTQHRKRLVLQSISGQVKQHQYATHVLCAGLRQQMVPSFFIVFIADLDELRIATDVLGEGVLLSHSKHIWRILNAKYRYQIRKLGCCTVYVHRPHVQALAS